MIITERPRALTPFRHVAPPVAAERALVRPRLLDRLAGRFGARVVLVQANGGFGKSTLLAQAVAANRLDPRGIDVWLGCVRADADAAHLVGGLLGSLGIDDAEPHVDAVVAAVWRLAPDPVALILDDAHLVGPTGSGAEALAALVGALPANGHVVLGSRTHPTGVDPDVVVTEADLAFDDEELVAFAAARSVPVSVLAPSGGWPAVAELRAGAGADVADDFLWEEVLVGLEPSRRRALGSLLAFGRFDDELVEVVTGLGVGAAALVDGLPLTEVDAAAGTVRLHDLWPRAPREPVATDGVAAGVALLVERGELRWAFDVAGAVGDDDARRRLLRLVAATDLPDLHVDDLAHLLAEAPADLRDGPDGELLRAHALMGSDGEAARAALGRAAQAFAAAGDVKGEVRALTRLVWMHSWESDFEAMGVALVRLRELAEAGSARARRSLAFVGGYAALVGGDPGRAVEVIEGSGVLDDPIAGPIGSFIAAAAHLDLGRADLAVALAAAALPRARGRLQVGLAGLVFEGRIVDGLPEDATVRREIAALEALTRRYGVAENQGQVYAGTATVCAEYGWREEAVERLGWARDCVAAVGARLVPAVTMAEVVVALLDGDEEAAVAQLRAGLAEVPLAVGPDRAYVRSIAAAYVLAPDLRREYDELALGPAWSWARDLARLLVAIRDGGDPGPAAGIDWADVGRVRAAVPAPFVVELAVAASAAGSAAAGAALETLPFDARPALRRLAEHGAPTVRTEARRLLAGLPTPPDAVVEVRVLGPVELWRDGEQVVDDGWRRERVRSLLQLLVDRRRIGRRALAEAMWPDLDERAAADNLRVNLNHLLRVLQPERRADEPSWFVESAEDEVALRPSAQLVVDVDEFDRSLEQARAAEADLDPARAVTHYRAALDRYRGDYLGDAPVDHWGEVDRTRLRTAAVEAAVRAGDLLVAGGEPDEAARLATWAAGLDPYVEAVPRLAAAARLAVGDRAGAWRVLDDALTRLRADGLQPEPATLRMIEDLRG